MTTAVPTRIVREVAIDDREVLTRLIRSCLQERSCPQQMSNDPDDVRATVDRLYGAGCRVLIAETDGEPEGSIGFLVHRHLISGQMIGADAAIVVRRAARGRVSRLLIDAFEQAVRVAGADVAELTAWEPRDGRFYQALGYRPAEQQYRKDLRCQE